MVKRGCIDDEIRLRPFGKQLGCHVVFMNTLAGSFGPAGIAANAILDGLLSEFDNLNLSTSLAHAVDQVV
jgi:hypothetical protein